MVVKEDWLRRCLPVVALTLAAAMLPAVAQVNNTGTGDVAGDGTAVTDSNTFTLNSTTLALVKRAFDLADTPIPHNSSIPVGAQFKFLVYINNNSPVGVADVSLQDVLAGGFAYQTDSIKVDNSVANCALLACDATEELNIFQTADGTAALLDAVDGDGARYDIPTTTIDIGDESVPGNGTVSVAANSVLAVVFTVTMQ